MDLGATRQGRGFGGMAPAEEFQDRPTLFLILRNPDGFPEGARRAHPERSSAISVWHKPRRSRMRVFILYANPSDKSFGAALHRRVIETLQSRHHLVDDCDLYADAFNPVMSRQERENYHDTTGNLSEIAPLAGRLTAAQGLVFVYPVWNEGFPAILKGFFDRVFIPGVSFKMNADGSVTPSLGNLTKLAAVCTYGADRISTFLLGDPPRRVVKRLVRAMPGHSIRCDYLAHYNMNNTTPERRARFLNKVGRAFEAW
jgi:NAD(P)H dehydrogenase (quinone)